jgi:hypothetical protein
MPTEAHVLTPRSVALPITAPAPRGARAVVALAGLALVALVIASVAVGFGGLDEALAPVSEAAAAAENVGARAVEATLPAAEAHDAAPIVGAPSVEELDGDIARTLERRGLTKEDAALITDLRPLLARWDAARSGADGPERRAASVALIKGIAGAPITPRVMNACVARAESAVKSAQAGPKTRAQLEKRVGSLRTQAKKHRSEAERSRIVLDAAELGRDARR